MKNRNIIEQRIIELNIINYQSISEDIDRLASLMHNNPHIKSIILDIPLNFYTFKSVCGALEGNTTIRIMDVILDKSIDTNQELHMTRVLLTNNRTMIGFRSKSLATNEVIDYMDEKYISDSVYEFSSLLKNNQRLFYSKCEYLLALDLDKSKTIHASKIKDFKDDLQIMIDISSPSITPNEPEAGTREYYMNVDKKLDLYWWHSFTRCNLLFKSISVIDEKGITPLCMDIWYIIAQFLKPGDIKHVKSITNMVDKINDEPQFIRDR